jgi:hypothetical protein
MQDQGRSAPPAPGQCHVKILQRRILEMKTREVTMELLHDVQSQIVFAVMPLKGRRKHEFNSTLNQFSNTKFRHELDVTYTELGTGARVKTQTD